MDGWMKRKKEKSEEESIDEGNVEETLLPVDE